MKKFKNKDIRKRYISLIAIVISIVSFTALCLIQIYQDNFDKHFSYNILTIIFSALFPVGIISLFYNYFDNIGYAEEHIKKAIFDSDSYLRFNDEKKKDIKDKISKDLYGILQSDSLSFIDVVQKEIEPLIKKYFIEDWVINIDCIKEGEFLIKRFYETIVYSQPILKNKNIEEIINEDEFLSIRTFECSDNCDCTKCEDAKKCYKIDQLKINNKVYEVQMISDKDIEANDKVQVESYNKRIKYNLLNSEKIKICNNKVSIEILYSTKVPLSDNLFSHKIRTPCKNYTIHFNYDKTIMDVIPCGFGFMDIVNKNNERYLVHKSEYGVKVRFQNWLIPGDGICMVINYLNQKDNLEKT